MKTISLIEAPSNLGLIEPAPGVEPGVRKLPGWLRSHGLYEILNPKKIHRIEPPQYDMLYDVETGVRNSDKIVIYSEQLADEVAEHIRAGLFPVVLGGDCSILIGCALGVKKCGQYGLFFMDGHTDYVTPPSSHTKGAAGMDLAIITGNGHDRLTQIAGIGPYIYETDVFAFGNRDLDDEAYVNQIERSEINYFDLNRIRSVGIQKIARLFLNQMKATQKDGFWIHLDVDVLENNLMPCVDSPQPGGLIYDEFKQILMLLLESNLAAGINITILDPDLDHSGKYTRAFVFQLSQVIDSVNMHSKDLKSSFIGNGPKHI